MEHQVVSREEWLAARRALLAKEKELTRRRDEISAELRAMPWVKVDKEYVFETPAGPATLGDLFAGRSQLFVYHFMFAPGQSQGCPGCSFLCDHVDGARQHFENHDVKFVAVSRAPLGDFAPYKTRMGWTFDWVSSAGSDFNYDFGVSFRPEDVASGNAMYNFAPIRAGHMSETLELPGMSVFYKDDAGDIYHTYSSYGRGGDILIGAHNFLDMTPKGRNEATIMDWMRRHDEYDGAPTATKPQAAE